MKITEQQYLNLYVLLFSNYKKQGIYTMKAMLNDVETDLQAILTRFDATVERENVLKQHDAWDYDYSHYENKLNNTIEEAVNEAHSQKSTEVPKKAKQNNEDAKAASTVKKTTKKTK